ncbi:MAG: DUF6046 domain-containing protein [Paludibacter sp.]
MGVFDYKTEDVTRMIPIIDIGFAASVLGDVFGFNSPIFLPYGLSKDYEARGYSVSVAEVVSDEVADRLSQFGTPVLGSFTIAGGKYKVYEKMTGKLVDKEFGDFEFPVATIVDFSRAKIITETPTIGSSGTVKEIFGFEDWKISIRGICLHDSSRVAQKTAKEQQLYMASLNEIAGGLGILKGKLFFEKGITRIVMKNISFTAVQGKPGMIQYEVEAVSDEDFLIMDI